jgi:hypothetical protein
MNDTPYERTTDPVRLALGANLDAEQRHAYARRHTAASPESDEFAALRDSVWQVSTVARAEGTETMEVVCFSTLNGDHTLSYTDEAGNLRMGASIWLRLDQHSTRTAATRVARALAGLKSDVPESNDPDGVKAAARLALEQGADSFAAVRAAWAATHRASANLCARGLMLTPLHRSIKMRLAVIDNVLESLPKDPEPDPMPGRDLAAVAEQMIRAAAHAINADGWTCEYHEPMPFGECDTCYINQRATATRMLHACRSVGKVTP